MRPPNRGRLVIAGDVGATKTNLGLFSLQESRPVAFVMEVYPSRSAPSFHQLIANFLDKYPESVSYACFGVPGVVDDGRCRTTNLPWTVSEKDLQDHFHWDQVRLVNDLVATATAIGVLEQTELFELNPGRKDPLGPIGVIAPGTGLGMALVFQIGRTSFAVPSEGGHANFAPSNDMEIGLLKFLLRSMPSVSLEKVASGPGLYSIYCWLREVSGNREDRELAGNMNCGDPSQVVSLGALEKHDPLCMEALDLFVSILGSVAGNLALTALTRGGVYLGGGICPKILTKLAEGSFMGSFTNKGRFRDFLTQVPVHVILNDKAGVIGAACLAFNMLA